VLLFGFWGYIIHQAFFCWLHLEGHGDFQHPNLGNPQQEEDFASICCCRVSKYSFAKRSLTALLSCSVSPKCVILCPLLPMLSCISPPFNDIFAHNAVGIVKTSFFSQTFFAKLRLPRQISEGKLNKTDWAAHICNYELKLKPSKLTTETATTVEPYLTFDLPITKRFYKQKRKQLQILNPLYIN